MFERHTRDSVTSRLRLRDYDYSLPGTYFVTICTARRACLFGDMVDGQIILNPAGVMIDSWWHSIRWRFPEELLGEMVVMPNHVHGIVSLGTDPQRQDNRPSLSDIVHWFKTKTTNDYGLGVRTDHWQPYAGKLWQPGYNDRIIRTEAALERIRTYIVANPSRWDKDDENPNNSNG